MNLLRLPAVVLLIIYLMAISSSAGDRDAIEVIENLHATLLAVMKDGAKIGYRGRYDRLEPVIKASFDLPFIARTAVGRYWETFHQGQKTAFVETFIRLSIGTYAANFDTYSGERFKVTSAKELGGGRILIHSQLTKSDGGEVEFDYILHRMDHQWCIINVIADGVSDLALKRADYSAFLKNKGFDALLDKLNEKIAQYSR
jgi:phospholipid transport system substrate-binding protein